MTDIRESRNAVREGGQPRPAFSWPGRRRADEAAEAAEKAALRGLERLRERTSAEQLDTHAGERENGAELRGLVFEATQQLRDAIKVEANELGRLIRAEQASLRHAIESLQKLTAELRVAAPAETKNQSYPELPPASEKSVDLNQASHADLRAIGMSETQASRVLRYRDFWGNFESVAELDHVPGFSEQMRRELDQRLTVRGDDEEVVEAD